MLKDLETLEIFRFRDEIQSLTKKENQRLEKSALSKFFMKDYSSYAISKMKEELLQSTNYKVFKQGQKW